MHLQYSDLYEELRTKVNREANTLPEEKEINCIHGEDQVL